MNVEALNKKLSLIVWVTDETGKDDVAVFAGTLTARDNAYFLNLGSENPPFEIRNHWLSRICEVQVENKELLLGADYQLSLSIGNLPTDDLNNFAGLKWPN